MWWISWWDTDARPKSNPAYGDPSGPGCPSILGYWESGMRDGPDDTSEVSVCALLAAPDEDAAWMLATEEWEPRERRFCKPHDGRLGDRFPLSPWMRERIEARAQPTGTDDEGGR